MNTDPQHWTGLVTAITGLIVAVGVIINALLNFFNNRKAVTARAELQQKMDTVVVKADAAAVKAEAVKDKLETVNGDHQKELVKITAAVNGNSLRERKVMTRRIADLSNLPTDRAAAEEAERALAVYEQRTTTETKP